MKKQLILLAWLPALLAPLQLPAQQAGHTLSGTVSDSAGQPVSFASVKLYPAGEGTTADSAGRFHVITPAQGRQTLVVSALGYQPYRQALDIDSAGVLRIVLQKKAQQLRGVVISAGSFEASDKAKGASLTPMDAVTVAGSNADLAMALRSLPGAQQVGEQAGLFVRGGTGAETKQFIDGLLLPHPNYPAVPGLAQPARVNPFLFSGILFSSGGYSALYGGAMSSALILESVDLPEESSASFSAFLPGNLSAGFQQLSRDKKSSFGINADYANQALYNGLVKQQPDYYHGPEYYSGNANLRWKTGDKGMLKLFLLWDRGHLGMRNPDIDSGALLQDYETRSRDLYANISYRQLLGEHWKLSAGAAYDNSRHALQLRLLDGKGQLLQLPGAPYGDKNGDSQTQGDFAQGRAVATRYFRGGQSLSFGAETFYTRDRYRHGDTLSTLTNQRAAAFAEGHLQLSERLAARLGLRLEHASLLDEATLAPRLSLAYRVGAAGQFNLAYGQFYQMPESEYLRLEPGLQASRATHYILNYTLKASNRFFRVEAYYKKYHDLVKTDPAGNSGDGYAHGIELFWRDKKSIPDLDYWVSYTYLDTKRNYLNYPYSLRPDFAAPHTATLAVKKFFPDISTSVNVSYAFASGRPYYDLHELPDGAAEIRDQGHTKPYSVANLHVAYLFSMFKSWKHPAFSGVAAGVNNLLGTRQVFGYRYSADGRHRTPVTLPARQYFFLGFFTSLGVDRTSDVLDNINSNL